jgi:hypothetical protein
MEDESCNHCAAAKKLRELDGYGLNFFDGSKSGFSGGITIRVLSPPDPNERP